MDEHVKLALQKFRSLYPEGSIPKNAEKKLTLNVIPENDYYSVMICHWITEKEMNVFFEAHVSKDQYKVLVKTAQNLSELK